MLGLDICSSLGNKAFKKYNNWSKVSVLSLCIIHMCVYVYFVVHSPSSSKAETKDRNLEASLCYIVSSRSVRATNEDQVSGNK